MAVISKLDYNGQDITRYNDQTISNINFNGVDYHFANESSATGVGTATCENAVNEPIIDMQISGQSFQDSGKNILPRFSNETKNGITTEWQEDGTLRVYGTATADAQFYTPYITLPPNSYYLSGCPAGGSSSTYRLLVYFAQHSHNTIDYGSGIGYTSTLHSRLRGDLKVSSGQTVDLIFKPMLEVGTSATEYAPYILPTTENPVEIQSIGEQTKNLLNKETSDENYFINSSGEKRASSGYGLTATKKIYVKPDTTYVFSGMGDIQATTVSRSGYQYDENDNPIKAIVTSSGGRIIFTTEQNCSYVYMQYVKTQESPMLEEGETATEYEPYGYKVPFTISGKNLFDEIFNYGIINSDTGVETQYTNESRLIYTPNYIKIKPNTEYTMTNGLKNLLHKVRFYDINKNYIGYTLKNNGVWLAYSDYSLINSGTTPDNAYYVRFELDFDTTEIATAVKNGEYKYMLELGSTATEYEPYKQPTTTTIYLDEPLRKIGDYADILDYKNKKVVRNIKEVRLTGSEDWVRTSTQNSYEGGDKYRFYYRTDIIGMTAVATQSNKYIGVRAVDTWNSIEGVSSNSGTNQWLIIYDEDKATLTTTEFKEFIKSEFYGDNPIIVDYVLATPVEEVVEMPEIFTEDGTTIVGTDTEIKPSNITVDYWKQI